MPAGSEPTQLALGPIARVERAPGGHVHLHVGPVTVRLSPSAAASVSETLAEAVRILELELSEPSCLGAAR